MKALRALISVIFSIGIVFYLLYTPDIIMAGIERGRVSRWEKTQDNFTGIIDVWHIVSFKAHTGSVSSWLTAQAGIIENKYFGVFLNVTAMTESEYQLRLERGERADIYSFPLGVEYCDRYLPMDMGHLVTVQNSLREGFLSTGMYENTLYAVPYMYSGYCLSVNNELMQKANVEISQSPDKITRMAENLSKEKMSVLCGDAVYACQYGVKTAVGIYDEFKQGTAYMAFCDFRAVGDSERRLQSGKGFQTSSYVTDEYTDLVQFISLDKQIDNCKLKYAYEFIEQIFSTKAQDDLSTLNAYGVIRYDNVKEQHDLYSSIAYDAFSTYAKPDIPNCFLYKRYKTALYEDATAALDGDKDALVRFTERMKELIKC